MILDRLGPWADGTILREAEAIDLAIYRAIAATLSPALDDAMRSLSGAADHSKLWLAAAAAMALFGGRAESLHPATDRGLVLAPACGRRRRGSLAPGSGFTRPVSG